MANLRAELVYIPYEHIGLQIGLMPHFIYPELSRSISPCRPTVLGNQSTFVAVSLIVSILRYLTYIECTVRISACRIGIHSPCTIHQMFTSLELLPARFVDRAEFLDVAIHVLRRR